MPSQHKSAVQARKWRAENPERAKILRIRQAAISQVKLRQRLDQLKSGPCVDCKEKFPPECMDFDHVRGNKKFGINTQHIGSSAERLAEELAKCDLVCSNCHRIRTRRRMLERE